LDIESYERSAGNYFMGGAKTMKYQKYKKVLMVGILFSDKRRN